MTKCWNIQNMLYYANPKMAEIRTPLHLVRPAKLPALYEDINGEEYTELPVGADTSIRLIWKGNIDNSGAGDPSESGDPGSMEGSKAIEDATITLTPTEYVYDGTAKEPKVTVVIGSKTLTKGVDYEVSYSQNTDVGTATVTVTGIGNYTGHQNKTFEIKKADQKLTAAGGSIVAGNSKSFAVTGNKGALTCATSNKAVATASISGNTVVVKAVSVGTATITINAAATTGYNAGTCSIVVKVLPIAPSVTKAENLAKGIKVTWKAVPGANGYTVLRNGKSVKKVSGVTYKSAWSASKKVKIKQ